MDNVLLIPLRYWHLASCGGTADPETTVRSTVEVLNYARDVGVTKIVVNETLRTTWMAKAVSHDGRHRSYPRGQEDVLITQTVEYTKKPWIQPRAMCRIQCQRRARDPENC